MRVIRTSQTRRGAKLAFIQIDGKWRRIPTMTALHMLKRGEAIHEDDIQKGHDNAENVCANPVRESIG